MPTVETVVINSVTFPISGAWEFRDLTPLMQQGGGRGQNVTIPGSAGVGHRNKVLDTLTVSLPFFLYGDNDKDSVAHADVRTGLKDNLAYLNGQLLDHNVGDITATVTYPDTSTLSGTVSIPRITVENLTQKANVLRGVIRVVLIDGKLT